MGFRLSASAILVRLIPAVRDALMKPIWAPSSEDAG